MSIKEILKSKSEEEILKDLKIINKDFLEMVCKIYPKEYRKALIALSKCKLNISIYVEEIKKDLKTNKEFLNKDFLNMILKLYPEELEKAIFCLSMITLDISFNFYSLLEVICNGQMVLCNVRNLPYYMYLFKLCGLQNNIQFVKNKDKDKDKDEENKVEENKEKIVNFYIK